MVPMGIEPALVVSVLALACSALAVIVIGRRNPTAMAKSTLKLAQDLQSTWASECALFEATRERWSAEFSGIAERCDESLDRAESKRRRVAATESRANPPSGGGDPFAGMSRQQIVDAGRRMARGLQ